MDTAEIARIVEAKTKELEDLKRRLPSYKDRQCGKMEHGDPAAHWIKIEELEEEIVMYKQKLAPGGEK
ncbi:hypothetical protein EPN16_02215 [bacterium]|nr:MAG: hypothetical protein EPN16_02215 [bacterium]